MSDNKRPRVESSEFGLSQSEKEVLRGVVSNIKSNNNIAGFGLYNMVVNNGLNKSVDVGHEWKKYDQHEYSSNKYIYTIHNYGDSIISFQIESSEKCSIQLVIGEFTIGTYDLEKGINNIIPVVRTPGLMTSAFNAGGLYVQIHSPIAVTIQGLNTFLATSNEYSYANVKTAKFKFVGPQGDIFEVDNTLRNDRLKKINFEDIQ